MKNFDFNSKLLRSLLSFSFFVSIIVNPGSLYANSFAEVMMDQASSTANAINAAIQEAKMA